jgi:hypothetical protein
MIKRSVIVIYSKNNTISKIQAASVDQYSLNDIYKPHVHLFKYRMRHNHIPYVSWSSSSANSFVFYRKGRRKEAS